MPQLLASTGDVAQSSSTGSLRPSPFPVRVRAGLALTPIGRVCAIHGQLVLGGYSDQAPPD
eukprot:4180688-Amphidinium_carterae.1